MITFKRNQAEKSKTISTPCHRSLNLLAHAQIEELDIGSQCGGHGHCGKDRIQVIAPKNQLSSVTAQERIHLSEEELQSGWRLGCQCWPEEDDLELEVSLMR